MTRKATVGLALLLLLAVAGASIFQGVASRTRALAQVTAETHDMAITAVSVTSPEAGAPQESVTLPGTMQPLAEASINARTSGYLHKWYVDLGAHVHAGQLLADVDTPEVDRQLDQARADLLTAEANARLAKTTAERYQDLVTSDSVSKQDVDTAVGTLDARNAAVASAQANVRRLEQLRAFARIEAPFDGVVTARNAEIGALVDPGGNARELFHLASTRTLRVFVQVPQIYSRAATSGSKADLTLKEFPGRHFPATLVRSSNAIDVSSRTLLVEFDVDNAAGELLPGSYCDVHLALSTPASTLRVPVNALIFRADGLHIAKVQADSTVSLRPVTLGRDFGTTAEVTSGLDAGDRIVVNPPDSLSDGALVRAVVDSAGVDRGITVKTATALAATPRLAAVVLWACLVSGCAPKAYHPPMATLVPAYKENADWKQAEPQDQLRREDWWSMFGDPQLNALEARVNPSNQVLRAATAQFEQARALLRVAHAAEDPTVVSAPSISGAQPSGNRAVSSFHRAYADFLLPVGVSYEADVWARVRNALDASERTVQASAADLESVSLSLHAELAADYVTLIGLDDTGRLLDESVQSFERALELTRNRFRGGLASQVDVALAQTQLESTRAQRVDLEVARAAVEHAIAVLVGQPAGAFAVSPGVGGIALPVIPVGLPSDLLERRPDIAGSERRVAAANAQVGVAQSALYPLLTLTGTAGFESASFGSWLATASHFWTIVPTAAVTLFDGGRRHAVVDQATAVYDQTTALYQQSVLNGFREVEDQLAALRVLEQEAAVEEQAVAAATQSLTLATNRYRGGIANYLEVLTAQTNLLSAQRTALTIRTRRLLASVQLVKALGGGWSRQQLPPESRPHLDKPAS